MPPHKRGLHAGACLAWLQLQRSRHLGGSAPSCRGRCLAPAPGVGLSPCSGSIGGAGSRGLSLPVRLSAVGVGSVRVGVARCGWGSAFGFAPGIKNELPPLRSSRGAVLRCGGVPFPFGCRLRCCAGRLARSLGEGVARPPLRSSCAAGGAGVGRFMVFKSGGLRLSRLLRSRFASGSLSWGVAVASSVGVSSSLAPA